MRSLVQGVGVNDADYVVCITECLEERLPSGRKKRRSVWQCPYYSRWCSMLQRCYSKRLHKRRPTYSDCTVCDEWLLFSNFREWMVTKEWEGKDLDKDILFEDNKVYSPTKCVFVTPMLNKFLLDSGASRGKYLLGVDWKPSNNKFQARCSNPITKKYEYLGLFNTEVEAHLVWKVRKKEIASQLITKRYITDIQVISAVRARFMIGDYYDFK